MNQVHQIPSVVATRYSGVLIFLLRTIALRQTCLTRHSIIATFLLQSEETPLLTGAVTLLSSAPDNPLAWRNTFHVKVRSRSGDLATSSSTETRTSVITGAE